MKTGFLAVLIGFALFSCTNKSSKQVFIEGTFSGEIPEEIKYSIPVNGICYEWFSDSAPVDSSGRFEFSFKTDEPSFVTIFLWGNRANLLAEPGRRYNLSIEIKEEENNIQIDCYNIEFQEAYQSLESPIHPQLPAMQMLNLPTKMVEKRIDSQLNAEIEFFEKLRTNKSISNGLFEMVEADRKMYYASVLEQVAMLKFVAAKRANLEANTDSITKMWNEAFAQIPLNSEIILKSKWAFYHLQNYLLFQEYMDEDFSWENRREVREKGRFHTYIVDISEKYLTGNILEFYDAAYILSSTHQKKFEMELVALFEDFKNDFPDSRYISFIEPQIEKVVDFQRKAVSDFDEGVKFPENYDLFNSLEECLLPFRGKKVYLDIWATTCGPCKKEFAFNLGLKNLLAVSDTEVLYISTDRDEEDEQWRNMIKYYQLSGNHIRANKKLKEDLKNTLGRYGIPRYLLVNEKGEIVNNDAPHPNDLQELKALLLD